MKITHAADGETTDRSDAAIFEGGSVWGRALSGETDAAQFNLSIVQFGAGARTRPHRHSTDQALYVLAGIGKVGTGDEEHVVSAGDFILIPANEEHWHGAADTGSPMSHLTILGAGSETTLEGE